jgi:hypothetical protein
VSASCVSVASQFVCFMCISYVPVCLFHVYQLRLKLSASYVSVASSQCVCFMCISCVPMCLVHVYQLRPNVSGSCVSVASKGVCFICISILLHVHKLLPKLSTARLKNCISCFTGTLLHVCHTETRPNLPNRTESEPAVRRGTVLWY